VRLHRGRAERIDWIEHDRQEPADQQGGDPPPKTNAFHDALQFNPTHPMQVKSKLEKIIMPGANHVSTACNGSAISGSWPDS
jgi:hypothetical protein